MQKTSECSLADKWLCFNHSSVSACNISAGTYLYKQYLNEELLTQITASRCYWKNRK